MRHVCFNKMSSCESSAQTELTGQDTSSNNASQLTCVFTGIGWMGSPDTEHLEHGRLSLEYSTASNSADFNRRHGHGDMKVSIKTRHNKLVYDQYVARKVERHTSSSV